MSIRQRIRLDDTEANGLVSALDQAFPIPFVTVTWLHSQPPKLHQRQGCSPTPCQPNMNWSELRLSCSWSGHLPELLHISSRSCIKAVPSNTTPAPPLPTHIGPWLGELPKTVPSKTAALPFWHAHDNAFHLAVADNAQGGGKHHWQHVERDEWGGEAAVEAESYRTKRTGT